MSQLHPVKIAKEIAEDERVWAKAGVKDEAHGVGLGGGSPHKGKDPCNFFYQNGWCRNGTNCKYRHSGPAPKFMRGRGGKGSPRGHPYAYAQFSSPPQSPGQIMPGQMQMPGMAPGMPPGGAPGVPPGMPPGMLPSPVGAPPMAYGAPYGMQAGRGNGRGRG